MRRLRQLAILLPALLMSWPAGAAPVISVTDATLVEGSAGSTDMHFTVTADGAIFGAVSVAYATSACTATPGEDYVDVSGFLTLTPESPSATVAVPIRGDGDGEGTESLFLHLADAVGAVIVRGRALGRILDDDPPLVPPRPRGDQDGDGRSDLVVRYELQLAKGEPPGTVVIWGINGQVATLRATPPSFQAAGWGVAATADVDTDGLPELVWLNPTEGLAFSAYAQEEGLSEPDFDTPELLPVGTPPTAEAVGADDFSGDGKPDLLTWDPVTGALSIWVLNGESIAGTETPDPAVAAAGWRPVAVHDFDGDGWPDVLWLHEASQQLSLWRMLGAQALETVPFGSATAPADSRVVAIGDFDGDGDYDLLWQEPSQELLMWFLEDGDLVCGDYLEPRTLELAGWTTWEVEGPR